jgi:Uma2 family endonuclease
MAMVTEVTRRRFTADEYLAMGEAGILRAEDRVELIDGDIVAMSPVGRGHVAVVNRLTKSFIERIGDRAIVQPQGSLRLDSLTEPQPDVALLRPRDDFYATGARPTPEDILLLVEIAESSLRYDLTVKATLYARHGIREYWVVDLNSDTLIRHTHPASGAYSSVEPIPPGRPFAPLALPDAVMNLTDVLGSPRLRPASR